MTLELKLEQLNKMIAHDAAALGLTFVNGPGPEAFTAPEANLGTTNGQQRGVYLFGVAEV